jgi:outer membrane protein assembly factor BamB
LILTIKNKLWGIKIMHKKILSSLIIINLFLMVIPATILVESILIENNIGNNINFNNRDIVDYVGVPLWIYDSDFYVKHIETADLNGDGIKDVIAGEYDSDLYYEPSNIYAINGLNGATFWIYTLNDGVRSMAICDLNNDGVMDVIAGASMGSPTPDGRVHAIDGTNGTPIWIFTPDGTGDTIGDIAIGDFDGNMLPDVAIACWDDYVYAINGSTGNQMWRTYIGSIFVHAVDTGDVNNDGIDDVSFANAYLPGFDNLQGVLNGTDGSTIWNQTVTYTVENTLLSDIDNDGSLEAIFGVYTSTDLAEVHVRNALDGDLEWNYTIGPDTGFHPDVFLFSDDIDEDNDLDLIVGNEYVDNYVYAFEGDTSTPMWVSEELAGFPRDLSFGDVIGNNFKNIIVATYDRVQILNATNGMKDWYYAVYGTIRMTGCADFNNDGILDVLCSGGAGIVNHDPAQAIWALETTEDSPILWEFDAEENGNAVAIDNLNGDIYMDVIGVTSNDKAWAIDGETGNQLWNWTAVGNIYSVTTGDLDGDGQIDVAVAGYDNMVTALYGNNGTMIWQFTTPTDYIGRKCLQSTDLNNDGNNDVIAGSEDGTVYAINGNNGTSFWSKSGLGSIEEVELAQMDDYGPLDVVTVDGIKAIMINGSNGDTLWEYDQNTAYAKHIEAFDLDSDGALDIAIGVPKMGATLGRLIMVDGSTHNELWTVYPFLPCSDYGLANGDLNNDGIKDLVAAGNYDDKKIHAFNGTNGNELWFYQTGGDVNVVATSDLNLDGETEVIAGSDDQNLYIFNGSDGSLFWDISTVDDVIHLKLGDISGDGYPNIALITFGFDGVVYAYKSFYTGQPPIANFTYEPINPYTNSNIFFNSTSYDLDGSIVNWTWDMDDSILLYGENIIHQYSNEGPYDITLTVTDDDGIPNSYSKTINVMSSLPNANFNYEPSNPSAYETVYFNSTSSSPLGIIVNWSKHELWGNCYPSIFQ